MESTPRRRIPFWAIGLIAFTVPALATVIVHSIEFSVHTETTGPFSISLSSSLGNLILIVGLALSLVLGVGAGAFAAQRKRA